MTLLVKVESDIVVTYLHAENEVHWSGGSKVRARNDRQTDRPTDRQTGIKRLPPHLRSR